MSTSVIEEKPGTLDSSLRENEEEQEYNSELVENEEEQNLSDERIITLPEDEEYEDSFLQNGPPSDEFVQIFNSIPPDEPNSLALEYLLNYSWSQYTDASVQVVMEGNFKAWVGCSIYLAMIRKKPRYSKRYMFSFLNIQKASSVSILELFDKLERYTEIIGASKRIKEQIHKMQGSLAVAAVVYKKFLPIFRGLFTNAKKKTLKQEDLLNSYNLLLCVVELFYDEICKLQLDEMVNPSFSERLAESDSGILEFLCKNFGGSVLDAKHFKAHWFMEKVRTVLDFKGSDFFNDSNQYMEDWHNMYEEVLQGRAEVDERMFLPMENDFHQVFDEMFDGSAVELLRRGPDDSTFADVELLLRMSTQNCLERLTENKKNGHQASKTYILSSDNLFPTTPLNSAMQNPAKLASLIPEGWQLPGSQLELICSEMREDPLPTIALNAEIFAQKFHDRVALEAEESGMDYDPTIYDNLISLQNLTCNLYFTIVERIVKAEREKKAERESDLCSVYRKDEFLSAVFCCSLELVLFCHSSRRSFPWTLNVLDLQPIAFQKIVQLVIRLLPEMNREMVKHLNKKEEEVLEEFGWQATSPIWIALEKNPHCIPSCDLAWKSPKMLAERYSPVKRMKLDERPDSPARPFACSMTLIQFIGKVYYLACNRLNDICDRIKIGEQGKRMCWTLFDHVLKNETILMYNRHLDQCLLCIVYVVSKYLAQACTFVDLISHYRNQPQAQSHIYREVYVDSSLFGGSPSEDGNSRDSYSNPVKLRCGSTIPTHSVPGTPEPQNCEKIDLIMYYNKIFLPRVDEIVKSMESTSDKLLTMPKPVNFGMSPMKRTFGDRSQVFVTSLNTPINSQERRMRYNLNQISPRKDLQAINQMVNVPTNNSQYFHTEVPEVKAFPIKR